MQKIKDFIFTYIINLDEKWINPNRFFSRWGVAIVLTYGVWLLFAFFQQEHYLFFPSKHQGQTMAPKGAVMEVVNFETEDEKKLTGVFLTDENSDEVILYFHENAGNITNFLGILALFERLEKNALIFDYRDFGASEGPLKQENDFILDAEAAMKYLAKEKGFTPEKTILWGKELGGFFATKLAQTHPPKQLILENPMSGVKEFMPWFLRYGVPSFLIKYEFDLARELPKLEKPPLILRHTKNEIPEVLKPFLAEVDQVWEWPKNARALEEVIQKLKQRIQ